MGEAGGRHGKREDSRERFPAVFVTGLMVGLPVPAGVVKGPLHQADARLGGQLRDMGVGRLATV